MNENFESLSALSKLANQAFYRYINQNPAMPLDQVLLHVERDLLSQLINKDEIAQEISRLQKEDTFKGVLNPYVLEKSAKRTLYFLFLDAKYGRYNDLQEFVKQFFENFCVYTLYGSQDSLIGLYATEDEIDHLFNLLDRAGFSPLLVGIKDTLIYYGYKVDKTIRKSTLTKGQEKEINSIIDNFNTSEVSEEKKNELIKQNLILGPTIIEDYHSTNRIQAMIGLTFHKTMNHNASSDFSKFLYQELDQNNALENSIRSIYKCSENFTYLIRIVADTMSDLDEITDLLNPESNTLSGLETKTFIFAKLNEVLPEYTRGDSLELDVSLEVEAEHIELIKSIEKEFITPLSRKDQQIYKELNRDQRLELIEALRKIDTKQIMQLEYLKRISPIPIDETFTDQILRGFINQKPSELVPAAVTMGAYVEEVLTNELKHCLSFIYPIYNLKFSHDELKWPKGKIEEFTLGNIAEMFSRINDLDKFTNLKIEFPPLFFEELNTLIVLRNHAAHGVLVKYLNDNFSLWFRRIVEMHEKAYYIFSTIQNILYRDDLIEQALQTALLNINFSPDYQMKEEIISEIKLSNESIIKLITNSNEQNVNRFYAIIAEFKLLSADRHRFEAKAGKVIQYFDNNEELITAYLTPIEQSRLEKLHRFLTKDLPADVFTNTLASILFGLVFNPDFEQIIMEIIKIIR